MTGVPQDELRAYFARVRPVYNELFSIAHAILGNCEAAEFALQRTILDGWQHTRRLSGRLGFREGLRSSLKQAAYSDALLHQENPRELTWDGLQPDAVEGAGESPLMVALAQQTPEERRVIALRYGCGYRPAAIARLTQVSAEAVRAILMRFEARVRRGLRPGEKRRAEAYCQQAVKAEFVKPDRSLPDPGTVFRTFQVEADQANKPRRKAAEFLWGFAALVLMLFMACVFYLTAVLVQSPSLEKDGTESIPTASAEAPLPEAAQYP